MASRLIAPVLLIAALAGTAPAQNGASVSVRPAPGAFVRSAADGVEDVVVLVDGRSVNAENVELARGGQIMIWLRELEKLGWGAIDASTGEDIRFRGKGVTLQFIKGSGVAKVNSLAVRLPIDTYTRDGRLMVPLSFVAKALGFEYESAPSTVATVRTAPPPRANSITGNVLYNGKPASGMVVRAANAEFAVVKNVMARTDSAGDFVLSPIPDGQFMAYVYTGDNPQFFNRASELAEVKGGQQAQVKPITVGRILGAEQPKPGSKVSLSKPRVELAWTVCPGAAKYVIHIGLVGKLVPDIDLESKKPAVSLASSKLKAGLSYAVEVTALNAAGEFLGGTAGSGREAWTFEATK